MTSFAKTVLSCQCLVRTFSSGSWADIFEPPAEAVPLLHTWSLAVEEQFMFSFPIAILMIGKFSGSRYAFWLGAFAGISMGISIWGVEYRPAATFYSHHACVGTALRFAGGCRSMPKVREQALSRGVVPGRVRAHHLADARVFPHDAISGTLRRFPRRWAPRCSYMRAAAGIPG